MPLFTLPIATSSSAPQSRVKFSSLPVRKRKRPASPTSSLSSDDDGAKSQVSRSEAAASTNPLSLTPAEVLQYRLAGLELDEAIPAVKGWPHRGFAAEPTYGSKKSHKKADVKGKAKERISSDEHESDESGDGQSTENHEAGGDGQGTGAYRPRLRLQHLSVLTTILQRCLLEGDIPRASRAWAMLIRAQIGGQGIDLRGSGYWAIGAELLMRGGEKPVERTPRRDSDGTIDDEAPKEYQDGEPMENKERRWGSAEGLEKTKEYYERMILQHPYKRQFSGNVSALDLWPAMLSCEIYGIQYERKEKLREISKEDENEDAGVSESLSDSERDDLEEEEDRYAADVRRKTRRRQKRAESTWQARDEVRAIALAAYEKLAARLDDLMTRPPYSDSHVLLRLRGMLALCIGDLGVPALPFDEDFEDEDEENIKRNRRLGMSRKDTERRLLSRQRLAEHQRGKSTQREQHIRARKLFERIERESGRREAVTGSLPGDEDGAEESFDTES